MVSDLSKTLRQINSLINYATLAVKEDSAVHELLDIFHDCLNVQKNQDSIAPLTPTKKGQTAITFKCKLLNFQDLVEKLEVMMIECVQATLGEEVQKIQKILEKLQDNLQKSQCTGDNIEPFARFVIKLQPQELAQNELLCTNVFKLLNINTPDINIYRGDVCEKLKKTKQLSEKIDERKLEDDDLIIDELIIQFMPTLDARTFESLFTHNPQELLELTSGEWKQMMEEFGKIAMIDLFIGNDDRLFDIDLDEKNVAVMLKPYCNAGNIMFYRPIDEITMRRRILDKVYAIDCVISNGLHKDSAKMYDHDSDSDQKSDQDIDVRNLRASDEEWGTYADLDNGVDSEQEQDRDVDIKSDSDVYSDENDKIIEKLYDAFKHFSKKENITNFAEIVAESIKVFMDESYSKYKKENAVDTVLDVKMGTLKSEIQVNIETGCLVMSETLKSLDLSKISLSQECLDSPLNMTTMKLIRMNLELVMQRV